MQQKFTTFKLIFIGLLVILGVGFAQAWTAPTATAPGNNTPGPLNSGDTAQGLPYSTATDKKISLYIKTQNTSDVALLADGGFSSAGQIEADGKLLVDLSGDSSGNTADTRDVLRLYSGDNSPTASNIVVDKSKLKFWSTLTNALASVRAGLGLSNNTIVGGTTSRLTKYTLDLSGTTNIGRGDTCTLITTSDRDTGCPVGSALISTDKNATKGFYGICRFFDPKDVPVALGGCYGGVIVLPQCSDGDDNDGDGKVDFPNDPGCTSASDNDEYNAPDLCSNITGIQATVPAGYTENGDGTCSPSLGTITVLDLATELTNNHVPTQATIRNTTTGLSIYFYPGAASTHTVTPGNYDVTNIRCESTSTVHGGSATPDPFVVPNGGSVTIKPEC